MRDRYCLEGAARPVLLIASALAPATPLLAHTLVGLAVLTALTVVVRGELACRTAGQGTRRA